MFVNLQANRAPLNHQKRKLELSDESKQSQSNIRKSGKLLSKRRWQRDGEIFEEGDDVYVVLDEKIIGPSSILEESAEDEADNCSVCKKAGRKARIECGKCMSCFHLECLSPPLEEVPQGIWICQDCCSGKPPRTQRALVSAREYVLQQKGLGLARIERVFLDKTKDEYFADCRWFYLPEETHIGRQNHHTAREMFLSSLRDRISMDTVLRHAKVITLAEYSLEGEAENDMFICDYEYDEQWGRFFRITEWDGNNEISKDDESDDEEKDSTFTLSDALELNCDLKRKKFYKRKKSQGGGVQRCLQLGITSVPDQERLSKNSNSILNASKALSLTAIPDSMPCREKERSEIEDFVRKTLSLGTVRDGSGKCLYICGIPGTGKTATVLDVLRNFSTGSNHNMKKSFHLIEINGLQLPSPLHVYSRIYEALTGEAAGPSSAMQALEEIFAGTSKRGSKSRRHIIVMLDEMDSVVSKSQKALYNLFDWPSRNASNFSIIGIANTMDLPERLHPRIGSRLAGAKVVFHPYQRDHLEQIMKSRLQDSQLFEENAVILAARKVANCSGDVRRCLELCRRAIEISLGKKKSNKMNIRVTVSLEKLCFAMQ